MANGPELNLERLHARFGRRLGSGEILFREGEEGSDAFLLEEGKVRLLKKIGGSERSLMLLRQGDFFGESALLPFAPRSSTAIAMCPSLVLVLNRETLAHLLEKNPEVSSRLMNQLARRLREAEDQIELMMIPEPRSRVVGALLKLVAGTKESSRMVLSVAPVDLSTKLGVDIDVVRQIVRELDARGYVRAFDEELEVLDLNALRLLFRMLGTKDEIST